MAVDLSKIAASAIEAALDDGQSKPKRRHTGAVTAVAAGAALAVAAKAATSKRPLLTKLVPTPSLDGLRDIPDRVRDRLADSGWLDDEDVAPEDEGPVDEVQQEEPVDEEDEEPVDEEDEDFDDEDEEPVDEEDEDFDDEDEEPVDEEDEDFDDEE